ncbi:hypothetical protein EXIGLDRAFT_484603 [Exidia glandulosa HHB12029]|uniref:DUF7223 domain-containing protein n=1 Tax=Exidia glandulosa HHB12029 TaxID=1314781 RepID=A0A165PKD7_EXIGL|nr:hypothetical protein EXIGLDRAFT_484603 [Exidia glandulosa HHB12029]
MLSTYLFLLAGVASASASASLNDWNKPCTGGACTYMAGDGRGKAYGALSLSGPSSALSDITPIAGWQITGCSPNWSEGAAHVKITCAGSAAAIARCGALFENTARDTIVRLPENCGTGPFARIVSTVDVTKTTAFSRGPEEHLVVLDYNFHQISHSRGAVAFSVTSSNVDGVVNGPNGPLQTFRRRVARGEGHSLSKRISKTKKIDLPPVSLHRDFNLFNASIDCPAVAGSAAGFSAGLDVDVNVGVDAQIAFGFTIAGNIFPPKVTKFNLFGSLNGSAAAEFDITAHATGQLDTGNIALYSVGLPGLNFPGYGIFWASGDRLLTVFFVASILNVGPQFIVNGQLSADLEVEANVKTGVNWVWPDVQLVFPPSQGASSAHTTNVQTPFVLSVDPSVTANGLITANVIPRVEVGIKVLSGLAEASVYLDLAASATLDLSIDASATAHTRRDAGASGTASGCAKLDGGIDIYAGAKGVIKPIFDKDIKFDIFQKDLNVFSTCFGNPASKTLAAREIKSLPRADIAKRDLVCPDLSLGGLLQVLNL